MLAESNAILWYLSDGTAYRPADRFAQAKIFQWLSFEADYVQATVGSLRFWTLTGKLPARPVALVESKRAAAHKALSILDHELATRPFIAGETYTIADHFDLCLWRIWRLTSVFPSTCFLPSKPG